MSGMQNTKCKTENEERAVLPAPLLLIGIP